MSFEDRSRPPLVADGERCKGTCEQALRRDGDGALGYSKRCEYRVAELEAPAPRAVEGGDHVPNRFSKGSMASGADNGTTLSPLLSRTKATFTDSSSQ